MEIFRSEYNSDRKYTDVFRKSKITSFFLLFQKFGAQGMLWAVGQGSLCLFTVIALNHTTHIFDKSLSRPAPGKISSNLEIQDPFLPLNVQNILI